MALVIVVLGVMSFAPTFAQGVKAVGENEVSLSFYGQSGFINQDNVPMMTNARASSDVIMYLQRGERITYSLGQIGPDGTEWTLVDYNGTQGWVEAKYISEW